MGTAEFSRRTMNRKELLELAGGLAATAVLSHPLIRWLSSENKPAEKSSDKPIESSSVVKEKNQKVGSKLDSNIAVSAPTANFADFVRQKLLPEKEAGFIKNGIEFLEHFGLKGKIVYLVYGRPNKAREKAWGSLSSTMTAEQSWALVQERAGSVAQKISKKKEDFSYLVVNPVYSSGNGDLKDIYVETLLKLAMQKGVVALDFSDIQKAKTTLLGFEEKFPKEILPYLSVSLDAEHFSGGGSVDAKAINDFSLWYAEKHQEWCQKADVTDTLGFVFVYTFRSQPPGCITNLSELKQYCLQENTLIVPVFDGYGSKDTKLGGMAILCSQLPSTTENPALIGTMEFQSKWEKRYDSASIAETFSTLQGAPVYFFASQ